MHTIWKAGAFGAALAASFAAAYAVGTAVGPVPAGPSPARLGHRGGFDEADRRAVAGNRPGLHDRRRPPVLRGPHRRTAPRAPDWREPEAHSGRLGTARVGIELRTRGEQTLVITDGHPLRGLGGTVHVAPLAVFVRLRHRNPPANPARTVERTTPAAAGVAGATAAA
ncbi:SRPBCC family protein [Streptomyces sp. NPDC019645]|uniref:SRPBCC family protein n=1 Tax=Streptomyces sp. NPDC019645 TaxID=3154786 RepID=UPI0033EF2F25